MEKGQGNATRQPKKELEVELAEGLSAFSGQCSPKTNNKGKSEGENQNYNHGDRPPFLLSPIMVYMTDPLPWEASMRVSRSAMYFHGYLAQEHQGHLHQALILRIVVNVL